MKAVLTRGLCLAALLASASIIAGAQEKAANGNGSDPRDPRVGLKAGFKDAGQAARNMELVESLPKPEGFFDLKEPAGIPSGPERDPKEAEKEPENDAPPKPGTPEARQAAGLNFANSDLAFSGNYLFVGNFNGFNIYDIQNPKKLKLVTSVVCPGGQGDVSVYGKLLVMSVEQTRGRIDCGTQGIDTAVSSERFRGVRIFDISDIKKPRQVAAVQTCRGSHTHTLVTSPKDKDNLYVYGSGTGSVRSPEELAGCTKVKDDPDTSLFSIDVIQVPLAAPEQARIVNRPRIFSDPASGAVAGLWKGGDHGPGTQKTSETNRCHDITVFPELGLAAGACSGNGILLDISDPVNPVRLDQVEDKNFAFWHSATFNNDGTKVIFTDEWGGGTRPRCRATDQPTWGADAIFDIVDRKLRFASYYKMPAPQTDQENCVAHNGSLIPVPGRDIMAQAWYQGGISVFDFTDSTKPVEIAFFDRGPLDAKELITGGHWSTYWYNGYVYGTEIARGIDVLKLLPSEYLSENELEAATQLKATLLNVQDQARNAWPATSTVARAYLDQLRRSNAIQPDRASAVKAALEKVDKSSKNKEALSQLETLATQLEADAGSASGRDAERLRLLAETLKGRAAVQ
jgi:LVIVD repeat-containing protein